MSLEIRNGITQVPEPVGSSVWFGQKIVTQTEMVVGPGQDGGVLIILVLGDTQFSRLLEKDDALFIADSIRELALRPAWEGG